MKNKNGKTWENSGGGTPINAERLSHMEEGIYNNSVMINSILGSIFPIGRGFIDFTNTDYSNYLGFAWERELIGMTPVGLDINQTEFNTIGKTGGEKAHKLTIGEMPSHNHQMSNGTKTTSGDGKKYASITANAPMLWDDKNEYYWSEVTYVGGDSSHNNLQPYQVVSYWKRVA